MALRKISSSVSLRKFSRRMRTFCSSASRKNVSRLNSIGEHHLHAIRRYGTFAPQLLNRGGEVSVCAVSFKLQESSIGASFLIQVRIMHNAPLFQDQYLVACIFDVPQQV